MNRKIQTLNSKKGYTLVEILVVAGILAVLAGLIATVFVRAKGAGKRTSCISNLSQIGKGLIMYASDHDGLAPPYLTRSIKGPEIEVVGNAERWRDSLARYTKSNDIFYCPSDSHAKTDYVADCADKDNSLFTSYETTPIVNGQIGENKSVIVNVDSPKFENIAYCQDRICMGRDFKDGSLTFTSYHGETATALFLDGHVKHMTITDKK